MVNEPIDCRQGRRRIDEDITPLREGRIGSNRDALALVAFGNQLEEHRRFGLIAAHVRQIVQDDQIEAIELASLCGSRKSRRAA